jgi:hypothetical protein
MAELTELSDRALLDLVGFRPLFLYTIRELTHPGEIVTPDMHIARLKVFQDLSGSALNNLMRAGIAALRHPGQRRIYEKLGRGLLARDPELNEFVREIYNGLESLAAQ